MAAIDLEAQRRALLEEELRLQARRVRVLESAVIELEKRRVKPGCGRPLGPDNYVTVAEMAQETPYSEAQIQDVMDAAGSAVGMLPNNYGRGRMVAYHWGSAQAALQDRFGARSPKETRVNSPAPKPPMGGLT